MELTEHQRATLEVFANDAATFDMVCSVMKDTVDKKRFVFVQNVRVLKDRSNEEIGAKLRAFDEASDLIDSIFREIEQYKSVPVSLEEKNPAR